MGNGVQLAKQLDIRINQTTANINYLQSISKYHQ